MTEARDLIVEQRDRIGVLTLNRPEKRNALTPQLLVELHLALEKWSENKAVRVIVIRGGGNRAFSAGYDVSALPVDVTPEAAEILKRENPLALALDSIRSFPWPVIAMMNGYAFGAGLNLAMCCDLRLAARGINVGMPPARLGLVYHPEGLRQFLRVLGPAVTREVFLTARTYEGEEVRQQGFVHRLFPAEELAAAVFDCAGQIAANAPLAVRGMKEILNMLDQGEAVTAENLARAEALIQHSFASRDLAEGQAAFLEKRKPDFEGR
ncbi:MAG: enoyl-CoA hydratase/isomerase family protein [Desulfosudaceae bacterium]